MTFNERARQMVSQKSILLNLGLPQKYKISLSFHWIIQRCETFVAVAPRACHDRFNTGFNIASAVNCAYRPWFISIVLKVKLVVEVPSRIR